MGEEEKKRLQESQNALIRRVLVWESRPPKPMMQHYTVVDGKVKFRIPDEFEIALELNGAKTSSRWQIVELKLLVEPVQVIKPSMLSVIRHEHNAYLRYRRSYNERSGNASKGHGAARNVPSRAPYRS